MDLVGKYIAGRYEMLEKVGNGGMATVYKAKDRVLNRFVAVKVLKDEYTTDTEFIRRFNAEAQSAAGLTHANIVSVYDVGEEDGIHFIVMELIQGKTLKEIINKEGTLPWKWSVNIAIQIASALEAAHKNNIVHRDIKPHNIIITEDGVAKVTDFGIAKAVSNSTITAFGTTIGSVHYFSPEHARGGYTDAKSDLYSLGVVMYEMLTGRVPFDADTPVSIALKHMQEKPIEPIKLNPTIPFALNQIIVKAMQKEPSARYQSATEMLKDLSMALKNPEGKFVTEAAVEENYTRRMQTITDDMLEENKDKNKKKKESFLKKHPKLKIVIWVVLLIIVFITSIIITKFAMDAGSPKDVQIPELVGLTAQEVEEKLKDTKFTYEVAEEEFREQFLSKLQENMKTAQSEFKNLNQALQDILFSNERYEFLYMPSKKYRQYYEMIMDDFNATQGESIFSGIFHETHKAVIEELFERLALDNDNTAKALDEFTDYRTYMDYDIRIWHSDNNYSLYSKVCEEKSGGETQTPFYVTVAASFVQLYRNNIGGEAVGLVMFDEAFNNMDDERIGGVLQFLRKLPLQILIAAPPDKIQYISPAMEETLLVMTDEKVSFVERYINGSI